MLSLLKEDVTSSFSDLWYRVSDSAPTLSIHARITLQAHGAGHIYIVEDPAGGNYYRLSAAAYHFVGMLDGRTTVDEAWRACNTQLGDEAPTQRECIDLLSRLQLYGLLMGDQPLSPEMIEQRRSEAAKRKRKRRFGSGISVTIPILNPERFLERTAWLFAPIFSRWGLAVYVLVVCAAIYQVVVHRGSLSSSLNNLLDPSQLIYMSLLFIALRAIHEFGHAAACKAMGGRCTEVGLMLVAFILPFPYCDTSSAWRFPEVYKRVIVSAGGMIFETFIAALAAILWTQTGEDAPLLRSLLFNTMVISGITTLVFNANPLLRYDGYYILSDITGSPNLAQRAGELTKFLINRHLFKAASARPPSVRDVNEFWLLLGYHLLATPYRLFITIGIVLFLWRDDQYLTIGALIAIIAGCLWLVWPMMKMVNHLFTAPMLLGRRARALGITGCIVLGLVVILGVIPVPYPSYAMGVLEPRQLEPIRAAEDGFVERVEIKVNQVIKPGDVLVQLHNPVLEAELERAKATVDKARIISNSAAALGPAEQTAAAARLSSAEQSLERTLARKEALTIRAGIGGVVAPSHERMMRPNELLGRFVSKGTLLGTITTCDDLVVRTLVADKERAYIFGSGPINDVEVSFRVRGDAGRVIQASIARAVPAASHEATQRSLTTQAGGEILLDPRDAQQKTMLLPQFLVELTPKLEDQHAEVKAQHDGTGELVRHDHVYGWQPGLRARVRFETPARPLAWQWWRSFSQYMSDKTGA